MSKEIKPVTVKKYYTAKQLKAILDERIKEYSREDDDEDSKAWINQMYWNMLL